MKPGVAGRRQPIVVDRERMKNEIRRKKRRRSYRLGIIIDHAGCTA
jgi:hypothetical protein